jgi:hypothetical protein
LLKSIQYEDVIFNVGLAGRIVGVPDGMCAVKFDAVPKAALTHGKYLRRIGPSIKT